VQLEQQVNPEKMDPQDLKVREEQQEMQDQRDHKADKEQSEQQERLVFQELLVQWDHKEIEEHSETQVQQVNLDHKVSPVFQVTQGTLGQPELLEIQEIEVQQVL